MNAAKLPGDCSSLAEIRNEIDRIDRAVIDAIGLRRKYVLAAARFKTNAREVAAPERFAAMLETRRAWAAGNQLNPDLIEKLYRDLVSAFIAEERSHWESQGGR